MSASVLFFRHDGAVDAAALAEAQARTPGHQARVWRPDGPMSKPHATAAASFRAYSLMDNIGLFSNSGYGALLLAVPGREPDHVSGLFPRFFRFPFMGVRDIQIGATGTHEDKRGQGLAHRAILEAMAATAKPGRAYWYLTEAANEASVRTVEKAGFVLAGEGIKKPRFGLRFFGYYAISSPAPAAFPRARPGL